MLGWLRRLGSGKLAPLAGAPAVRRRKTYSARNGYVYQYFYQGYRAVGSGADAGTQFVFEVSADRKTFFPVSVFLAGAVAAWWEQAHGRSLNATERYAAAKMALFQAFDERKTPGQLRSEISIREADLAAILDTLGIE